MHCTTFCKLLLCSAPLFSLTLYSQRTLAPSAGGSGASALNGQYAFLSTGVTSASPSGARGVAMVGSFTADGSGKITRGMGDFNSATGTYQHLAITGSYWLDASGRGVVSLTSSLGTQELDVFVPPSEAATSVQKGVFTIVGSSFVYGSGDFARQLLPQATPSIGLSETYVFHGSGETACVDSCSAASPLAVTGLVRINPDGTAGGVADQTVGAGVTQNRWFGGTYVTDDEATGRTTFHLVSPGEYPLEPTTFVTYPVDATHFYFLSLDSHVKYDLLSGSDVR